MKWYYRRGSEEVGPIETSDLKQLVNRGILGPKDYVWHTDAKGWMRVTEARRLLIGEAARKVAPVLNLTPKSPKPAVSEPEAETSEPEIPEAEQASEEAASLDEPVAAEPDPEQEPEPEREETTEELVAEEAPMPKVPLKAAKQEIKADKPKVRKAGAAQKDGSKRKKPVAQVSEPDDSSETDDGLKIVGRTPAPRPQLLKGNREKAKDEITAGIVDRLRQRLDGINPEGFEDPLVEKPLARVPKPNIGGLRATSDPEPDTVEEVTEAEEEIEAIEELEVQDEPELLEEPEVQENFEVQEAAEEPEALETKDPETELEETLAATAEIEDRPPAFEPLEANEPAEEDAGQSIEEPSIQSADADVDETSAPESEPALAEEPEPETPRVLSETAPTDAERHDAPQTDVPDAAEAQEPSGPENADAEDAAPKGEIEADGAPSKQVANPVKPNRLPPRELIADFGPRHGTGSKDKIRIGKRLGSKSRSEETETEKPTGQLSRPARPRRLPSSLRRKADAEAAETDTQRDSSAQQERPLQPEARQTAAPASPDGDQDSTPANLISPSARQPAIDPTPAPQNPPNAPSASERPTATGQNDAATAAAAAILSNALSGADGTKPRDPRELAKAAAAALKRERQRRRTAAPQDGSNRPSAAASADGPAQTATISPATPRQAPVQPNPVQPQQMPSRPVQPEAPVARSTEGPASVSRIGQAADSAEQAGSTPVNRQEFVEGAEAAPVRPTRTAKEQNALRQHPARKSGSRKKGATTSRRRERTNIVPTNRTTLSAQSESVRSLHSRGGYSLARSFWVNLVLVTVVLAAIFGAGLWYLAENARVYPVLGLAAVIALVIILVGPWQIKGVWRSAKEHIRQNDGSMIARIAQGSLFLVAALYLGLMAILLVPVAAVANLILQGEGERTYDVKVNRNGTIIQVDGLIEPGLANEIDQTIRRSPRAHTLVLNSDGGYLFEARQLRDVIEASPIRATYTRTGCKGACLLPFMATDERVAEVGSALQIGGPKGAESSLALVDQRLGVDGDVAYLAERGIDPAQFDFSDIAGFNSSDRHNSLLEAGILTAVSVGNSVFRAENVTDVSKIQVERALLTVPFFDTIHRLEPDLFDAFRDGVAAANPDSVETDGLGDRTFDSANPLIEHVKATYLPIAPNRSADDLMAVLSALGDELRSVDARACVALVSPNTTTIGTSVAAFLEVDRRAAYYEALDQILVTADSDPQEPADPELGSFVAGPIISEVAAGDAQISTFLETGAAGSLSTEQQCDAVLNYFQQMRTLDLDERAAAFRQFTTRG